MKKLFVIAILLAATGTAFATNNNVCLNQVNIVNSVNNDVDDMIASYDKYVDKYIATMKKVKDGDLEALKEYAKLLKQAQDLQKKIEKCKDDMTAAQLTKFQKVVAKLAKAAQDL